MSPYIHLYKPMPKILHVTTMDPYPIQKLRKIERGRSKSSPRPESSVKWKLRSCLNLFLPLFGLGVDENPRMGDERVHKLASTGRQHTVADRSSLVVDPIQRDPVLRRVDELNEGHMIVVDRTKRRQVPVHGSNCGYPFEIPARTLLSARLRLLPSW